MQINGVQCSFHHLGIPTTEIKQEERYSSLFDMYTSDSGCESMRIQWHRFGPASSLHPIVRSQPHVAFKVDDLRRATAGMRLLLGPYEPIENFRVAIVEDHEQPIELIQTEIKRQYTFGQGSGQTAPSQVENFRQQICVRSRAIRDLRH
jgi:hypothetical protein